MLKRYVQLRDDIDDIVPVQLQLSPSINSNVSDLLKQLGQLDTLTKFLQAEDRQLYEVRKAFDEAAKLFPCLEQHGSEFSEMRAIHTLKLLSAKFRRIKFMANH